MYFLMSMVVLTVTCLLIVGAVFAFVFIIYKIVTSSPQKDPHFQFDDTIHEEKESEEDRQKGVVPLEKIVEVDEELSKHQKDGDLLDIKGSDGDASDGRSTVGNT